MPICGTTPALFPSGVIRIHEFATVRRWYRRAHSIGGCMMADEPDLEGYSILAARVLLPRIGTEQLTVERLGVCRR